METKRVRDTFPCPHCRAELTKQRMERLFISKVDPATGRSIQTPKRAPALIVYAVGKAKYEKVPEQYDLSLLARIDAMDLPADLPTIEIPRMHMTHERARMDYSGITHVHHFFLPRAAQALGMLWRKANGHADPRTRGMLLFFVEQAIWGMSVLNRYKTIMHGRTESSNVNQYLSGVYYVPSQHSEVSPWYNLGNRLKRLTTKAFQTQFAKYKLAAVSVGTTARLPLPNASIDYIFTDPPFGESI